MKKLILVLCAFLAIHTTNAQTQTAPAPKIVKQQQQHAKQVANPAAYACPKCFTISKGAGTCEKCNMDKVQLGNFYCTKCNKVTGAKQGKCATCQGPTTQITRKYCAAHGGTPLRSKGSNNLQPTPAQQN